MQTTAATPRARPTKVFGLGLSKTGTHSLNQALTILGFPAVHYPEPRLMVAGRFEEALEGFDAATDISVSAVYRELDEAYPGSKFILTVRDMAGWLESIEDHRARRDGTPAAVGCPKAIIRRMVYGSAVFEALRFTEAYRAHEKDVRGYFRDRPGDLLVLDVCGGAGWEPLCEFLGVPVPDEPFPAKNRRPGRAA